MLQMTYLVCAEVGEGEGEGEGEVGKREREEWRGEAVMFC